MTGEARGDGKGLNAVDVSEDVSKGSPGGSSESCGGFALRA